MYITKKGPMVSLIWTQASNGVIGRGKDIPWYITEDSMRFRDLTYKKTVIMGRNTWDTVDINFIYNRRNIVISRDPEYKPGYPAIKANNVIDAIDKRGPVNDVFIIGGAEVLKSSMCLADILYVTYLDMHVIGDKYAPEISPDWEITDHEEIMARDTITRKDVRCIFNRLIRKW